MYNKDKLIEYIKLNSDKLVSDIMRETGCARGTINKVIKENDLTVRELTFKKLSDAEQDYVKANLDKSMLQLSKDLNYNYAHFINVLKRSGLYNCIDKRNKRRVLSEEEKDFIRKNVGSKKSVILRSLGISASTLNRFIKEEQLSNFFGSCERLTDYDKLYIRENRHKGATDLARELKKGASGITKHALENGIILNDKGFCPKPKNILFDEITKEVDLYIRKNTHKSLLKLNRELGVNYWVLLDFVTDNNLKLNPGRSVLTIDRANYIRNNLHKKPTTIAKELGIDKYLVSSFLFVNKLEHTKNNKRVTEDMHSFIKDNADLLCVEEMVRQLKVPARAIILYAEDNKITVRKKSNMPKWMIENRKLSNNALIIKN